MSRSIAPFAALSATVPGSAARGPDAEIDGDRLGNLGFADGEQIGQHFVSDGGLDVVEVDLSERSDPDRAGTECQHQVFEAAVGIEEGGDCGAVVTVKHRGTGDSVSHSIELGVVAASDGHLDSVVNEPFGSGEADP